MFGWRLVGHHFNTRGQSMVALGFELRLFKSGERWCDLVCGRHQWTFVHYPRYVNRLTGPAENRAVLDYFHNGPDLRVKGADFQAGFAAAAKKRPVKVGRDHGDECACPGCGDPAC
jgi:hypothetical protein